MERMRGSDVAAPTDIENQLETLLKTELHNLCPMSPSRCIYRVPDRLRRVREKDYTPRVISIGPFHHGNEALKPMEVQKGWYLKCFMERSHSKLNDYIEKIRDQEEKVRNCYAETIVLSSDQFVRMILVDAIFLIEFLFRYDTFLTTFRELVDETDDCIFGRPLLFPDVRDDLLMLENQLPLFILEDLLYLYNPEKRGEAKRLSIRFVLDQDKWFFQPKPYDDDDDYYSSLVVGRHFVDLLRDLSARYILWKGELRPSQSAIAPSIEKLHLAGVKIQDKRTSPSLFDISFRKTNILRNGVLEIPRLKIKVSTERILRNLIAFEQCSICEDTIISDYVILMDMLVNRPKDAELLVDNGIVENYLLGDDKELCSMINRLSRGIDWHPIGLYYGNLCNDLEKFCNSNWHQWMANLRSNYFNTPWAIMSLVAATVLLILTFIQTISA